MKKILSAVLTVVLILALCGCGTKAEKMPVKVLIVPHFEVGNMSGDDAGEAQAFFEEYLKDSKKYKLCDNSEMYYNSDNRVAMCLSGCGKTASASSVTAMLGDGRFDYSNAYLVVVGCAGGACGYTTLGDVVIAGAVCDYDLGHTADIREMSDPDTDVLWYNVPDLDATSCIKLNKTTVDKAVALAKDIKLKTTEISRKTLDKNFPGEEWSHREPAVIKGTFVTGDNYWKGLYGHKRALQIVDFYKCDDPYAITEMEDIAVASVAEKFGLIDRTVIMRVSVNCDQFINGDTPEKLWSQSTEFIDVVVDDNEETLDIFVPAMENMFLTGKVIIDAMLSGKF